LKLSPREQQIVEYVLRGVDSEEMIAERLGMPRRTVHEHVSRLYIKLHVTSRSQLVLRVFAAHIALAEVGKEMTSS
jgi:DNA-binding NarL/FixJ family response regulator